MGSYERLRLTEFAYIAVAVLVPVAVAVLFLLASAVAQAGARPRGGRVRSATPDPRRLRGDFSPRGGMTEASPDRTQESVAPRVGRSLCRRAGNHSGRTVRTAA